MAGVDVAAFLGITPMVGKEELPNEAARLAENCRLEGGDLESWKAPVLTKALTSGSPILSVYRYGISAGTDTDFWFQWTTDVDVVRGPLANDIEERTYWTGDGAYPKKTRSDMATTATPYPSNHYRLGIPAPAAAPVVSIGGSATSADDPANTSLWGYTYVTTWDEEGPMSPLSNEGTWRPGQTPHLASMSAAPTGPYSIDRKRIYRSASGSNTTAMQFVAEIAVGTATYDDAVLTENLGRIAESRLWTPPPDDLAGLCAMANEMLAGFVKNTVRLSEPGVAYAWPERYSYNFEGNVVGIKPFGAALVVCTTRGTYILSGNDPSAMSQEQVNQAGVCLSKRGMVSMMNGVLYPTKLGLQFIGPNGPQLMTAASFDEEKWGAYKPSSFTAAEVNNRYVACYDTGSVQGSLIFSFVTPSAIVTSTVFGTALWQDAASDTLYVVQSNNVNRWNGGSPLTAKWKSKAFRFPRPVNMACARVEADAYPLTFKYFQNDVLIHTETVANGYGFPLPDGDETLEVAFQYEGTTRVSRVSMATSFDELKEIN